MLRTLKSCGILVSLLPALHSVAAAPFEQSMCSQRPLNVLLTGFMGHGKSTLVNVLHGIYERTDSSPNNVAIQSGQPQSCTLNTTLFENAPSLNGANLRILDTRGFEGRSEDQEISEMIYKDASTMFPEGLDAILMVTRIDRISEYHFEFLLDFMNKMIGTGDFNSEISKRFIMVLTNADSVEEADEGEAIKDILQKIESYGLPRLTQLYHNIPHVFYR